MLAFARAVADFTLAPDAERVLEGVMSLALVRAGVGSALSIRGTVYRTFNRRPFPLAYGPAPYRNRPLVVQEWPALLIYWSTNSSPGLPGGGFISRLGLTPGRWAIRRGQWGLLRSLLAPVPLLRRTWT